MLLENERSIYLLFKAFQKERRISVMAVKEQRLQQQKLLVYVHLLMCVRLELREVFVMCHGISCSP
jgi:hypothetical protein